MFEETEFDRSFYVLSVVGYLVLYADYLETPEGRGHIKGIFRSAMAAGGTIGDLAALPEFQAAVFDCQAVEGGAPVDEVIEARLPGLLARKEGA